MDGEISGIVCGFGQVCGGDGCREEGAVEGVG